jgi:hypothetical protein
MVCLVKFTVNVKWCVGKCFLQSVHCYFVVYRYMSFGVGRSVVISLVHWYNSIPTRLTPTASVHWYKVILMDYSCL